MILLVDFSLISSTFSTSLYQLCLEMPGIYMLEFRELLSSFCTAFPIYYANEEEMDI